MTSPQLSRSVTRDDTKKKETAAKLHSNTVKVSATNSGRSQSRFQLTVLIAILLLQEILSLSAIGYSLHICLRNSADSVKIIATRQTKRFGSKRFGPNRTTLYAFRLYCYFFSTASSNSSFSGKIFAPVAYKAVTVFGEVVGGDVCARQISIPSCRTPAALPPMQLLICRISLALTLPPMAGLVALFSPTEHIRCK